MVSTMCLAPSRPSSTDWWPGVSRKNRFVPVEARSALSTAKLSVKAAFPSAAGEVAQAVLVEGALTLEDWWVRRAARAWFENDGEILQQGAAQMAALMGWSPQESARQIDICRTRIAAS